MCVPTRPDGCGPWKSCTCTPFRSRSSAWWSPPARSARNTVPQSFCSRSTPACTSALRPCTANAGSAAGGAVSMPLTKIATGVLLLFAILPTGRWRNSGHSPAFLIDWIREARSLPGFGIAANCSLPPLATALSTTRRSRKRRSPKSMRDTVPVTGEHQTRSRSVLSRNSGWPVVTWSPSLTSTFGLMPGNSAVSMPTRAASGASTSWSSGRPASRRSKPFLMVWVVIRAET